IVIGNGPGDPKDLMPLVTQVRLLLPSYRKPVFGICLGHQILALAAGGDTYKLPYGHRGVNQPVQDLLTRRCYITSQNHGYAVRQEPLPADWEPWFVSINDVTSEGIRARTRPVFSVQFHPHSSPVTHDTALLVGDFMRRVGAMARGIPCTAPTPRASRGRCSSLARARCRSARPARSTTPAHRQSRPSKRRASPRCLSIPISPPSRPATEWPTSCTSPRSPRISWSGYWSKKRWTRSCFPLAARPRSTAGWPSMRRASWTR